MSSLRPSSLTLWLRPIDNITPREIALCAIWLRRKGWFRTTAAADKYLFRLEYYDPQGFRRVMSRFYEAIEHENKYFQPKDPNTYVSGTQTSYGQELHMYY
jgi:hypothetical protein